MTKTLFLTGASSGIGAATARAAAKAGWNVGLFARSEDKLKDLAEELGDQALVLAGDATDYDAQKQAIDKLAEHFGQVDAAFANAGRGTSPAGTEKGDPEDWKKMVDISGVASSTSASTASTTWRAGDTFIARPTAPDHGRGTERYGRPCWRQPRNRNSLRPL